MTWALAEWEHGSIIHCLFWGGYFRNFALNMYFGILRTLKPFNAPQHCDLFSPYKKVEKSLVVFYLVSAIWIMAVVCATREKLEKNLL